MQPAIWTLTMRVLPAGKEKLAKQDAKKAHKTLAF
jgi:hypothetical protein